MGNIRFLQPAFRFELRFIDIKVILSKLLGFEVLSLAFCYRDSPSREEEKKIRTKTVRMSGARVHED